MSGEIRQNPLTGQWVVFSPGRKVRPQDHAFEEDGGKRPQFKNDCPFCPGNEELLPQPIIDLPEDSGRNCQVRVVPNKFPALLPEAAQVDPGRELFRRADGYGRHQVIVEHQRHDLHPGLMSQTEVEMIIRAYRRQFRYLEEVERVRQIFVFRNHGRAAGASRHHPHSQILGAGYLPERVRRRVERAKEYYHEKGRCLVCDIVVGELAEASRVIWQSKDFLAFVPFAAAMPFEVWLTPRFHQACFGQVDPLQMSGLAEALRSVLSRLDRLLNNPDYNYVIHTPPTSTGAAPDQHWLLQLKPRLTIPAGFELGSGSTINPSWPEDDAAAYNSLQPTV